MQVIIVGILESEIRYILKADYLQDYLHISAKM